MTPRRPNLLGPLAVAITGVVMCIWSWGTWPDVILDFGRELYVPWQITEGKVLYRDIVSYFNGPLSPYVHALVFEMFGVGLNRLVWFNLLVVAGITGMLYWLLNRAWGASAATAGGMSFLVLFAFAQYRIAGNYNYVCPYSYELTHGIALTLAGMICLAKAGVERRMGWMIAAGVMLGLVFLTKAEIFLAAAVSLGAGVMLSRPSLRSIAGFVGGAIVPPVVAFLLLLIGLTSAQALRGMAGAWGFVGQSDLLKLPFFSELAGTDDVIRSLLTIVACAGVYGMLFGVPTFLGLKTRTPQALGWLVSIVILVAGVVFWDRIDWLNAVRAMPLLVFIAGVIIWREKASNRVLPLMLLIWSLAMLAKIPLNARVVHYGFALAMPVTVVGIALLTSWLPAQIDQRSGSGRLLRFVSLAVLGVMLYAHVRMQAFHWSTKTFLVGRGGDEFVSDDRAIVVNEVLGDLARLAPRGGTLAVVPEGLIINYLSRMENPTGQLNFTPPAMLMYGESEMLRAFKENPPDFLILTGVVTQEYGARFFGEDYARELGQWMQENYRVVRTIGPRPFRDPGFGLVLFRRSGG